MRTRDMQGALGKCLKSPLHVDAHAAATQSRQGIREALRMYVPAYCLQHISGVSVNTNRLVRNKTQPPSEFSVSAFSKLRRQMAHLVAVPIDKAPGELLICCPKFYDNLYNRTFSVGPDQTYAETGLTEDQAIKLWRKDLA